jgi:bis(5'-adenosyl)-triphosphatase
LLEGEEGDLGKWYSRRERPKFPAVLKDEDRKARSEEEMVKEAEWLAGEMEVEVRLEGEKGEK